MALRGAMRGALLLLLLAGAGSSPRADMSLAVVPPVVEKVVPAGSRLRDTLAFTNRGKEPVLVSVDFADFAVEESGDVREQPPASDASSLVPNLRISPMQVRVAPAQEVHFRYAVEVPDEFEQLRAMVFLSSRPDTPPGANQVQVVARMGVPIYVENTKASPAALRVEDVVWERDEEAGGRLRLRLTVANEGGRNIRPDGYVHVRATNGAYEATFDFNEGREPVLPGQRRRWELTFGPVAEEELAVKLRLATSHRASHEAEAIVPPFAP